MAAPEITIRNSVTLSGPRDKSEITGIIHKASRNPAVEITCYQKGPGGKTTKSTRIPYLHRISGISMEGLWSDLRRADVVIVAERDYSIKGVVFSSSPRARQTPGEGRR